MLDERVAEILDLRTVCKLTSTLDDVAQVLVNDAM